MIARIAYLTSLAPERYLLNFQSGDSDIITVEITKAHLANIVINGAALALREQTNTAFSNSRVPETINESAAHEHHRRQQPA